MLQYGIIGNCKTCALVSKTGSIDWMCYPSFDSPSIFGKILDNKKGGRFKVWTNEKCTYEQQYIPNTNILETIVTGDKYKFKIIDFFPRYKKILPNKKSKLFKVNKLIRIIEPIKGKPNVKVLFEPHLNYAREETELIDKDTHITIKSETKKLFLKTNLDHKNIINGEYFELNTRKYFVLGHKTGEYSVKRCLTLLNATKRYWLKWVDTLILPEKNRDLILRSALTLKLLTYSETGAIIAASTTSIPEEVGSERTWDYRYCWIRDAAFCADAFKKLGRDYESKRLMEFIISQALKNDFIQPLYGIRGETRITEFVLGNLSGFKGSVPVRVGNAAYNQLQNDIYGEIIDLMYLYFIYYEYEKKMTKRYWRFLRYAVNQIKFNWDRKDSGIWEFRGLYEHYTFSKLMCYIGIDRAIRIAQHYNKDDLANEWTEIKQEIREDIMKNGYNNDVNSFTIHYGSKSLDAANLLMAYYEFLDNCDQRLINTIKATYENLRQDYLVQRYTKPDDFGESKSAFTICSFWLVDALYYIGETEKAQQIFDKLIKKCNGLGLFSEDIDIKTKKLIGNFPQAYTHIAMINSSILLSEWASHRKKIDWTDVKRKKWF